MHNKRMLRVGCAAYGFVGLWQNSLASALLADGPLRAFYSVVSLAIARFMA
jgi:hypothetical protein